MQLKSPPRGPHVFHVCENDFMGGLNNATKMVQVAMRDTPDNEVERAQRRAASVGPSGACG